MNIKLVNGENLAAALYTIGDELVGKTPNGRPTSYIEELTEVGRLMDKVELIIARDYYSYEYQRLIRNFTEDELNTEVRRLVSKAGKKLIFLNGIANKKGVGFLTEFVKKDDLMALYEMLKSYQFAICTWGSESFFKED